MTPESHHDDWRLGHDADAAAHSEPSERPSNGGPAQPRLDRAIATFTVEHTAWAIITAWTVLTRISFLSSRALDVREASAALTSLAIAQDGLSDGALASSASWVRIVGAAIFQVLGDTDSSARYVSAFAGIAMIAAAFAMRRWLGRSGAIALGAMIALSPTLTYVSRTGTDFSAALTMVALAVAACAALAHRPTVIRGAAFACVTALALTAAPVFYAFAAPAAAMLAMAAIPAMIVDHPVLRAKVWWERRRATVLAGIFTFGLVWYLGASLFGSRAIIGPLAENFQRFARPSGWNWRAGTALYLPILGFYEFEILVFAMLALGAMLSARHRSRALFAIAWAALNTAMMLAMPVRRPEFAAAIILPIAIAAAVGVEAIANTPAWRYARIAIAVIGLLTINTQLRANFAFDAADASAPAWSQHPLLFWSLPAAAIQTRVECDRALDSVAPRGAATVSVPDDEPVLDWYLRDGSSSTDEPATISVSFAKANENPPSGTTRFGYQVAWAPDWIHATPADLLSYFVTMRAWSPVEVRDATIAVGESRHESAEPSSKAAAPQPLATATPSATQSSTPSATPTSTPAAHPSS